MRKRIVIIGSMEKPGVCERIESLRPWFERYDAISYARDKARWFTVRAGGELTGFPPTNAVDSLVGLTDFVVDRRQ